MHHFITRRKFLEVSIKGAGLVLAISTHPMAMRVAFAPAASQPLA